MSKVEKRGVAIAPPPHLELLTDREAAGLLRIGMTRFFEVLREPDFPTPVLLGERGRRHVRGELLSFAMSRRASKVGP